jgi:hypothetical protein
MRIPTIYNSWGLACELKKKLNYVCRIKHSSSSSQCPLSAVSSATTALLKSRQKSEFVGKEERSGEAFFRVTLNSNRASSKHLQKTRLLWYVSVAYPYSQ